MTTPPLLSMNAMVDAVTDAVEAAIARGNSHLGGVRRFFLQGAIHRVLRDIGQHRIPLRRHLTTGLNAGGRPSTSHSTFLQARRRSLRSGHHRPEAAPTPPSRLHTVMDTEAPSALVLSPPQ
ncbi:hypothetical protein SORBI_3008G053750 [Sorghum bicolor]|uniref:Uncharacterized protein n=1 Tax=Sorghum bicolor TaxID=4558 RepID=A0A1Z5R4V5_SORBI|nr:hypothetical protein SORBI_3008G053750 [Sorghum bicolor]